jgi:cell division protein FtsW (lipid II flippase)
VKSFFKPDIANKDWLQSRLLFISGIFLVLYSIILSLAPAVRFHSWQVNYRWQHWVGLITWVFIAYLLNNFSQKKYNNRDPLLLPLIMFLMGWGLLSIFRLNPFFGFKQTIWFVFSGLIFLFGLLKPKWIHEIRKYKYLWLTIGLTITALTFLFGIYPNGSGPKLWLGFMGVYIQPSEPLKLLFIVYLSAYLADQWPNRKNLVGLITPTLVFIGAAILILAAQRDLGTATIFILVFAFYMFIISEKRRTLLLFLFLLILAGAAGYQFIDVIQNRVDAWLTPWVDSAGISYQVVQSLQAIAAGKLIGAGPGIGSPGIVPVALSDFIFVVIAEETGLFGALALFSIYAIITYRGFLIAIHARNQYQRLLAAGITVIISLQAILILGGNTLFLPLTGVTLPFVSYGGSSLITFSVAGSILLWISQNRNPKTSNPIEMKPYWVSLSGIVAVFFILGLITGYWGILRSGQLLARPDNLRNVINNRYVVRGEILDRNNKTITFTDGSVGNYFRTTNYPDLSHTIGYIHPLFGLNGLELAYDGYLRGIEGLPSSMRIQNEILYAQPPPGLPIRTSLDLKLQRLVDETLQNYQGAALLMNADNGEILALWSAPTFNSNSLDENWETWKIDTNSPMINRVSQGQYPTGALITPFVAAYQFENKLIEDISLDAAVINQNNCALEPTNLNNDALVRAGCPSFLQQLLSLSPSFDPSQFIDFYQWDAPVLFELPVVGNENNAELSTNTDLLEKLTLSPLQVASTAAIFSNGGKSVTPHLGTAVNTPNQGWVIFPNPAPQQVLSSEIIQRVSSLISRKDFPAWEITSQSKSETSQIAWFVSGTNQNWKGTPMVLVLTLENQTAEITHQLGREIFQTVVGGSQ